MAAAVLVDEDSPAQLREGALRARGPVADLAARADRDDRARVVRLDSARIDQPIGVPDVAAEPDRAEEWLLGKLAAKDKVMGSATGSTRTVTRGYRR